VKRILHREDAGLGTSVCRSAFSRTSAKTREFYSAIDGFRAAIGKENVVKARPFRKFAGEWSLEFVVKQI